MAEDIKDREEIAEEAEPETDEQAVEQRSDDYEGIKRMLEDGISRIESLIASLSDKVDDADAEIVDSGSIVVGGADEPEGELEDELEDEAPDVIEDIISGEVSLEDILKED